MFVERARVNVYGAPARRRSSGEERAVLFTVIEGEPLGAHALVLEGGERVGDGVPESALGRRTS